MSFIEVLKQLIGGERVTTNETILEQHSHDESYHSPFSPEVVVFPSSTSEVSKILAFANEQKIPIVPYGLGTSLEGHVIPYYGGISLDTSLMNQVLDVRPSDFLVKLQPGVTRSQLNKELKKYGMFFTVDPGADATLGGMAATNASGTTSVKYGIMRDNVRDLEVVMANGEVIHTGGSSAKSSSGLHLNGLFVGSEGTLGVITELTLKLHGIPEEIVAARASFPTVENAVNAVVGILSAGILIARVEFLDSHSIKQVNRHNQTNYKELPTLFLEFHGNKAGLEQDVSFTQEIVNDMGCENIAFEKDSLARHNLWEARHNLAYSYVHGSPNKKMMITDVSLPISELTGAILDARIAIENKQIDGGILGHVGDGNFHIIMMVDLTDTGELDRAKGLNAHVVQYALDRGGTCTGEHGVGIGKALYQKLEHKSAFDVMSSIKKTLDPNNILNPGKIFENKE